MIIDLGVVNSTVGSDVECVVISSYWNGLQESRAELPINTMVTIGLVVQILLRVSGIQS